jgi:16S rRNA (adenine1518-N6/adenine1519-N6)-dimethyltransferase
VVSTPRRSTARSRALGQNFLVDPNILDVIERLAELGQEDVVLEVGGGLGVLSERLARRVAHVHVVEIDASLREALEARVGGLPNLTLHFGDALALDLGSLTPVPDTVVANLPYGIAATLILRTIEALPAVTRWTAMVQREVGARLAARPGTPAYGAPSVLAQMACEVSVLRPVARTVFRPVPRVDSVLIGLRRFARGPDPATRALVRAAFAHRRKTLAGSLALAAGMPADVRAKARVALTQLGHPPEARAERLSPEEFLLLARYLQVTPA